MKSRNHDHNFHFLTESLFVCRNVGQKFVNFVGRESWRSERCERAAQLDQLDTLPTIGHGQFIDCDVVLQRRAPHQPIDRDLLPLRHHAVLECRQRGRRGAGERRVAGKARATRTFVVWATAFGPASPQTLSCIMPQTNHLRASVLMAFDSSALGSGWSCGHATSDRVELYKYKLNPQLSF